MEQPGVLLGGHERHECAEAVANQIHLVLPEAPAQLARQLYRVADVSFELQAAGLLRVERLAGAALIPVHHDEVLFELLGVVAPRSQIRHPGGGVEVQQDRVPHVPSADRNPLRHVPEHDGLERRNRAAEWLALGIENGGRSGIRRLGEEGQGRRREEDGE